MQCSVQRQTSENLMHSQCSGTLFSSNSVQSIWHQGRHPSRCIQETILSVVVWRGSCRSHTTRHFRHCYPLPFPEVFVSFLFFFLIFFLYLSHFETFLLFVPLSEPLFFYLHGFGAGGQTYSCHLNIKLVDNDFLVFFKVLLNCFIKSFLQSLRLKPTWINMDKDIFGVKRTQVARRKLINIQTYAKIYTRIQRRQNFCYWRTCKAMRKDLMVLSMKK